MLVGVVMGGEAAGGRTRCVRERRVQSLGEEGAADPQEPDTRGEETASCREEDDDRGQKRQIDGY